MSSHPAIPFIGIAVIAFLVYTGAGPRAQPRSNYVPLKVTDNKTEGARSNGNAPDATLKITTPDGKDSWRLAVFDGSLLYEPKEQADRPASEQWTYEYRINRYGLDYTRDIGAWAGFRVSETTTDNDKGDVGLDVGIRYSPVRLGYGVISPDILVSPRQAGVGVSFYPPAQSVSPLLQHFGLGVAYMADYRGGSGLVPYLSLSTRF